MIPKVESAAKSLNFASQNLDPNKTECTQDAFNSRPLTALASGQVPIIPVNQIVHKVRALQIPPQNQQITKSVQVQAHTVSCKNSTEQVVAKMYEEQQGKLLACGKVLANTSQVISNVRIFIFYTYPLHCR